MMMKKKIVWLNLFNTRLSAEVQAGTAIPGDGEEGNCIYIYHIYLSLHGHHQNDSCIKIGSDESHFNVLVLRNKVTRQCLQTTTFLKRKEG